MVQEVRLKYFNKQLNIGLADWRTVYLINDKPERLYPETFRGRLVYRARGSGKRISYKQVKAGLQKMEISVKEEYPDWLYV